MRAAFSFSAERSVSMRVVLLGGDLNAYAVAISFHETFGVRSTVFCRYPCGITSTSSIVCVRVIPSLLEDSVGTEALIGFAKKESEMPYLIPCGDWYVSFLDRNRDTIGAYYKFLIPPSDILATVTEKASFYALLSREGLPYPKTVVLTKEALTLTRLLAVGDYPAVLKPSNSTAYYAHPFEGMRKVYFPRCPKDALSIAERIYESGYNGALILQRRIGKGGTAIARTLTLCLDKESRVRRGVLGEILIEETAAGARGNYAAILSRPPDALTCRIISLLEKMKYVGLANVDILSDQDASYILELNPRQGRSADYLRAAGVSLARFLIDAIEGRPMVTDLSSRASVWHAVPMATVMHLVGKAHKKTVARLAREGRATSVFSYKEDQKNIKRRIYVAIHAIRRSSALRRRGKSDDR